MLLENGGIEEVLFAEVAPRVGQNFSTAVTGRVAVLYVVPQLLHVVDALLANENCAAFQAHKAEGFLVGLLHVAPQTLLVWKVCFMSAVGNETIEGSQFHALDLGGAVRVVNTVVLAVYVALMAYAPVKLFPSEAPVACNYDFFEYLFAERAAFVTH